MHVPWQVWVSPVGFLTGDNGFVAVDSVESSDDDEAPECNSFAGLYPTTTVLDPHRQPVRQ